MKRRDSKGRPLRDGEAQDENGQYSYRYTDNFGQRHTIRSWRLLQSDPTPPHKKAKRCLRDMEEEVLAEKMLGLAPNKMTVFELVERYIATRTGVRPTTKAGYNTVTNMLAAHEFGMRKIKDIKYSDAKLFLIGLQKNEGKSYSSIQSIRGVLRPAFQMAFEDEILRYNPFNFDLSKLLINDSVKREAISQKQERIFLEFIKNDNHYHIYYDGMYILFHTGLRISEFCGLTVHDIDFKEHTLNVCKQLQRDKDGTYYIQETKTSAGRRVLPLTEDVEERFGSILERRQTPVVEPVVDGISGFLFLDKDHRPEVALHWEHHFQWALKKYNRTYELPKITPHVCRHTYCSNMAKQGVSPKTLQYLMGHSDIGITMNVYTHLGLDVAREEVDKVSKIKGGKRVIAV